MIDQTEQRYIIKFECLAKLIMKHIVYVIKESLLAFIYKILFIIISLIDLENL